MTPIVESLKSKKTSKQESTIKIKSPCREKLRFYEETERNSEIEIVFEAQDIQKELNIPIV